MDKDIRQVNPLGEVEGQVQGPSADGSKQEGQTSLVYISLGIFIPFGYIGFEYLVFPYLWTYKPWLSIKVDLVQEILFVVILLGYAIHACRRNGFWPLYKPIPRRKLLIESVHSFGVVVVIYLMTVVIAGLYTIIFQRAIPSTRILEYISTAPNSIYVALILVSTFTLIPIVEEVYYRGFLYNAFKTRVSIAWATAIQAGLFSLAHGEPLFRSSVLFFIGFVMARLYEVQKNLISPVLVHGILNALWAVPILVVTLQNLYVPAQTWEEAKISPTWLSASPPGYVERQENGMQQWQYVVDSWKGKVAKRRKREMNAFNSVCIWFPEEKDGCVNAKLSMVIIYYRDLIDLRRAIIEADRLVSDYPGWKKEHALAKAYRGLAYLMLKELTKSRMSFDEILSDSNYDQEATRIARAGIEWLNKIEGVK